MDRGRVESRRLRPKGHAFIEWCIAIGLRPKIRYGKEIGRTLDLDPYPLPDSLIELHFGLVEKFDDDRELLPVDMRRPAAFASHNEIIAVAIFRDPAFEGDGRALNRPFLACLWPRSKIAIIPRRKLWKRSLDLFTLSIMLKDQLGIASAYQAKAHADPGVVRARVTHGRIEGEGDADAAFPVPRLKDIRNRNSIDCEMVEGELVLGIQRNARIV